MVDPALRDLVHEVARDFTRELATGLGRLEAKLELHDDDVYAHQAALREVYRRLDRLEIWRAVTVGALSVLSAEGVAVLTFALGHWR